MKKTLPCLILAFGVALTPLCIAAPTVSAAVDIFGGGSEACSKTTTDLCNKKGDSGNLAPIAVPIVNTLLMIVAIIAVIMIILGGVKYAMSNGDSGKVTSAKNTITYAIVGLVVAILSYGIVNFVNTQLK